METPKNDCLVTVPCTCTLCGAPAEFVDNAVIYGRSFGEAWPYIWHCTNGECGASVGVQAFTRQPLGTFADSETRAARRLAHDAFDHLWRDGHYNRSDAYTWLARQMGLSKADCHIGHFDKVQCAKVIQTVMAARGSIR